MTRAAHRPVTIPMPVKRSPAQQRHALYELAGSWEATASVLERSSALGRVERAATAERLRRCADQLLAIVDGLR